MIAMVLFTSRGPQQYRAMAVHEFAQKMLDAQNIDTMEIMGAVSNMNYLVSEYQQYTMTMCINLLYLRSGRNMAYLPHLAGKAIRVACFPASLGPGPWCGKVPSQHSPSLQQPSL